MTSEPDVVWINGAFGSGKTAAAQALCHRVRGAALVDPEPIGSLLRRQSGIEVEDDYRDLPAWREETCRAVERAVRSGGCAIVPMTVDRQQLFELIVDRLRRSFRVAHFTLRISPESAQARLRQRGQNPWALPRVRDQVTRLSAEMFSLHVDADRSVDEVADEITALLGVG